MIIWINKPKAFEAAVILRFLYYSTGFENMKIYITNFKKIDSFVRYSRIPIKEIKEKINFSKPEGNFLIINPNGKSIEEYDIKKYDGFLIDFSNEIKGDYVKCLGIPLLHYEAISFFSKFFIKKEEKRIELDQEMNLDMIYFAKKILKGIIFLDNYYLISPRLLLFCLRNFEKKYGILVDMDKVNISINNKIKEEIEITFYNKKLDLIEKEKIKLEDNFLEIPLIINKNKKIFRFYIDFDNRRVYLNKNFFISDEEKSLEYFFNFL